jgi:hypothetical protein
MLNSDQDAFDRFAGQIMALMFAKAESHSDASLELIAKTSCRMADKMMAERSTWDCEGNGPIK